MVCFAGSIGIIGIAMVLAFSAGIKGYIASMQDDMLSGNPITIQETAYDLNVMMNGMTFEDGVEMIKEEGYVNVESMMEYLVDQIESMESFMVENDLTHDYVDYVKAMPKEYGALKFDYDIDLTNNSKSLVTIANDVFNDGFTFALENLNFENTDKKGLQQNDFAATLFLYLFTFRELP